MIDQISFSSASASKWCPVLFVLAINLLSVDCDINFNNNFQSVPTTIKTFENDTVLLPCNHEKPFRYIRWLLQDFLLVDTRYDEFSTPPERMHLWPNGSLQVTNLKQQDTGEYYCQMMTIGGLAQQTHAIEVQYPATAELSPSGTIETYIGSVVELVCATNGVPTPLILWRHKDTDLLENTQRLLLEINSKDQSGMVECSVSNNVGEPANASALLLVQFAPEVTALKTIVHTQNNMKAELECVVSALPLATVHWFRNGYPMLPDNRITKIDTDMTNKTQIDYYTIHKHTLRIRNVRDSDLGQYECRGENKIGFKGVQFELTGQPMPASFKLSPVPSMQTTYNLIWQTESLSRIHEYKLRFRKVPSGNVTPNNRYAYIPWTELVIPSENSPGPIHGMGYTLKGLVAGSVYEVVVLARNKYGWSDESKVLRFATTGEIEPTLGYTTELYEENEVSEQSSSYYDYENSAPSSYSARCLLITWMIVAPFSLL